MNVNHVNSGHDGPGSGASPDSIEALRDAAASAPTTFKEMTEAAIKARDVPLFQEALLLGANPMDYVDKIIWLKPACRDLFAVLLYAGLDPNVGLPGHRGRIINSAAACGQAEYVALLLEYGADPNIGGWMGYGVGPLGAAIVGPMIPPPVEQATRVIEVLIDGGALVAGSGALQVAAQRGRLDCARLLIERGADVLEAKPRVLEGKTPIELAREEGNDDMVALLAEHGAE